MKHEIIDSTKLEALFDRSAQRGEVPEFIDAVNEECDFTFATASNFLPQLMEYVSFANNLKKNEPIFAWQDEDEGIYFFIGKSETEIYNRVLRAYCRLTGHELKKKSKKK